MLAVLLSIADVVLVFVLSAMTRQVVHAQKTLTPKQVLSHQAHDTDLPSVTVCIPARNEQHALTDCLQRVLASSYEKLEIIVLDDNSGDNTSALIKSFASEGVRFIEGSALPEGWVGKNHALQGLLEEASGSYVLFIDVDTVLAPQAIENIVRHALTTRASMVSVLPRREDGWRMSVIASPLRYFWELVLLSKSRPAVSSSAWLIRRDVLERRFDGIRTYKKAAQPEARLAVELSKTDEYRFIVGTKAFGVAYEKKWHSQIATAIRLIYLYINKDSGLSIVVALDFLLLLVPFSAPILWHFNLISTELALVTGAIGLGFCALYGFYARRVWNRGWLVGAILWPLILLQELVLLVVSTARHERGSLKWRGRSIQPEA